MIVFAAVDSWQQDNKERLDLTKKRRFFEETRFVEEDIFSRRRYGKIDSDEFRRLE